MSKERDDLIDRANALDLEFQSNIPTVKLLAMVNEAETNTTDSSGSNDDENTAIDEEATPVVQEKAVVEDKSKVAKPTKKLTMRQKIMASKKKALATSVVTITNKDNRENDVMTTVFLGFENQYFGLSRTVPLDIPVELEAALIRIAESATISLHKDEIIGGKRTGNKITVRVKKFAISYSKLEVKE